MRFGLKVQISNLEVERTQTLAESKGHDRTDFNLDEAGGSFLVKYNLSGRSSTTACRGRGENLTNLTNLTKRDP